MTSSFFLLFALHVLVARFTQNIRERAAFEQVADLNADFGNGGNDVGNGRLGVLRGKISFKIWHSRPYYKIIN